MSFPWQLTEVPFPMDLSSAVSGDALRKRNILKDQANVVKPSESGCRILPCHIAVLTQFCSCGCILFGRLLVDTCLPISWLCSSHHNSGAAQSHCRRWAMRAHCHDFVLVQCSTWAWVMPCSSQKGAAGRLTAAWGLLSEVTFMRLDLNRRDKCRIFISLIWISSVLPSPLSQWVA